MMTLFLIAALVAVSLTCAFLGVRLLIWTITLVAVFLAFIFLTPIGILPLVLIGLPLAAGLALLNVRAWRQTYISAPFLQQYRAMLPSLSATEEAALEAGTVGWEGQLFSGKPDWQQLRDIPWQQLTDKERAFVDGPVEELCGMLNDWEISHELADLPPEIWTFLKRHRFFGMIIPESFGGLGFSALAHRAVLQKVSSMSAVAGTTIAVPNSLGPGELILHYGTDEQKQHYLPRLASGEEIPCFALTGPTAGSDATSIPDYGIVSKGQWQGQEVLGIRLTFDKRYITLAPVATVIGLAFRMHDPDGLLGGEEDLGISLALMPRDTEGLEIGTRHLALNVPFHNGPLRGKDVFLPLDSLIGGPAMAGKGWKMLVEALSVGRGITLPSSSTGGAKMCSLATGAYARIRRQFNLPIGRFEGVEEALARIAGKTYVISALSRMTTTAIDQGEKPAVPSAIAKSHATEMAREIITDAMDIHGGKGIALGPKNYLGRAWEGAPIWITVEGANILTRNMMIFGQGAIRCHPYVLKEMEAAHLDDPKERLDRFDSLLFGHMGYTLRNAVRSLFLGISRGRLAFVPSTDKRLSNYYRKLSRYSAALAFSADISMLVLGGRLKQKERLSARLADTLSHLYMASAVLYRYEKQGRQPADQPLVAWAVHHAVFQIQQALGAFADNFPNRWIGLMLRLVLFPIGRWERAPGDRLCHRVAQLLINPSEARDRLTNGIYKTGTENNQIGLMELALPQVIAAEPVERKLLKAEKRGEVSGLTWEDRVANAIEKGVISDTEAETLKQVRDMVLEVIAVDEFDSDELRLGRQATEPVRQSNAA